MTNPIDLCPIDMPHARDIVDGDMDLLQEIVCIFLLDYQSQVTALQQAITTGDPGETRSKAHRLKCSLGNIGGWHAYKLAYDLELMGLRGDLRGATRYLHTLTDEIERIVTFFGQPNWVEQTGDLPKVY